MEDNERRKRVRVSSRYNFRFRKIEDDSNAPPNIDGLMVDYSAAGIRFVTDEQLEKNTTLLIQLELNKMNCDVVDWRQLWETGSADCLYVIGSVMWCLASDHESGDFEIGTRFTRKAP